MNGVREKNEKYATNKRARTVAPPFDIIEVAIIL